MRGAACFSDLLEQFMSSCNAKEHWTTVEEFRTTMSLDKSLSLAISGFLRRLHNNPTIPRCKYTVVRIEKLKVDHPCRRIIRCYLIRERCCGRLPPSNHEINCDGTPANELISPVGSGIQGPE